MKLQPRHLNDSFIGKLAGFTDKEGYTQYGLIRSYNGRYVFIDLVNDKVGERVPISKVDFVIPEKEL